jgi:hypothetical protein
MAECRLHPQFAACVQPKVDFIEHPAGNSAVLCERHSRFVALREDKKAKDVVRETEDSGISRDLPDSPSPYIAGQLPASLLDSRFVPPRGDNGSSY